MSDPLAGDAPRWLTDVTEHLPESLLREGPRGVLVWQWLAALPLLALAWAAGMVLARLTRMALSAITARSGSKWDDAFVARLRGPLRTAWTLVTLYVLIPWLALVPDAQAWSQRVVREALLVVFFWTLGRGIDIGARMIAETPWALTRPASRSLVPLAGRVAKIAVLAMGIVAFVSQLGYPVESLIAGLGIGGLAFALAAQKTVENVFGAFSIGADQPFREGDFVKVEDFVGTVEHIGLRSTRIRTLDRTVVTMPNGKLADMRLESYTARDRMRLACTIGLIHETTAAQMREVLAGFERTLREHPKIWPDAVVVRFKEFASYSLDIEIMAWFVTPTWAEFQGFRQEVLLGFMDVVERAGTSFARPTRIVHTAPNAS